MLSYLCQCLQIKVPKVEDDEEKSKNRHACYICKSWDLAKDESGVEDLMCVKCRKLNEDMKEEKLDLT